MDQPVGHRGAVAVWLVALLVYLLAVFHRSSMAVAGLIATERFDISAAQLATFTMLQLLVYASLQVPVGLMLDRFGPRRVMLTGVVVMTLAQAGFAFAASYPMALLARVVLGAGDAMIFICVLRLVASWFAPRRIPLVTQMTGVLGQLGAVLAAVPMTLAFRHLGWTPTYLLAAGLGVVLAVALAVVVRDHPEERTSRGARLDPAEVRRGLGEAWAQPGTRLGLWTHFSTQSSATMLGLLWGYPYFVRAHGLSSEVAGLLLTIMVVAVMGAGPVLGWFTASHPYHRSTLVIGVVLTVAAVWGAVLAIPAPAPLWLLVLLVMVVGVAGPASMVGFDFARTSNPPHRMGSASGIINQGGYTGSLIAVVMVGAVLDWRTAGAGGGYTPEAFRWAMATQYLLWSVGLVQIVRYRRRARAALD